MDALEAEKEALSRLHDHDKGSPDYIPVVPTSVQWLVAGYTMVPHAQRWADDCRRIVGAQSFGTYSTHSPTADRAIDTFSPVPSDRRAPGVVTGRVLGDDIADFSVASIRNGNPYGIWYVIWRQHIFNIAIADYWRWMEDRIGVTNNHFDHNHNSFNASTPATKIKPVPILTGDVMSLSGRYVYEGLDYVFDGPSRIYAAVGTMGVLVCGDKSGLVQWGKVDKATHEWFRDVAAGWKRESDGD